MSRTDDLALDSPSLSGMRQMIQICEQYAMEYYIVFNAVKSNLMCINYVSSGKSYITLCGKSVDAANNLLHTNNSTVHSIVKSNCCFIQTQCGVKTIYISNV